MQVLGSQSGQDAPEALEILAGTRRLLRPAVDGMVGRLPAAMSRIVRYHLGTRDEHGRSMDGDGGKAFRPALALLACKAVGGDEARALPAAVAVELVHNASLMHDDIIDGDRTRRGRPAVWVEFGVSDAILAGDALFFLAIRALAEYPPLAGQGVRLLASAVQELVEGEQADLLLEARESATVTESQQVAAAKTGALIGAACALGALAGGGSAQQVEHMYGFGMELGAAFQFVDDLKGIWGDPAVTGKPCSDLSARKKSLPVAFALARNAPSSRELASLYQRTEPLTDEELRRAARLVDEAGGRDWASSRADRHIREAMGRLDAAATDARAACGLSTLADLVVGGGKTPVLAGE